MTNPSAQTMLADEIKESFSDHSAQDILLNVTERKMTISVEMSFNALKISFNGITHLRIDATKLIGHQSWREGYGNRKWVIEYTVEGGAKIVCEYDTEEKWKAILGGLDRALDQPNRALRSTPPAAQTDSNTK